MTIDLGRLWEDVFFDSPRLVVLALLLIANIAASTILYANARKRPHIAALRERSQMAVLLTLALFGGTILFADRRLPSFTLSPELGQWLSFGLWSLVALPGLYWLFLYWRGGFGK